MMWVDKDPKSKEVTPLDVPKIVKISCGPQHTVVVDDTNKAYSWGFGGYGRLGHSETGDELVPRLIQALAGKNRGVWSELHAGTVRDTKDGQHVGHLHPRQGGEHV